MLPTALLTPLLPTVTPRLAAPPQDIPLLLLLTATIATPQAQETRSTTIALAATPHQGPNQFLCATRLPSATRRRHTATLSTTPLSMTQDMLRLMIATLEGTSTTLPPTTAQRSLAIAPARMGRRGHGAMVGTAGRRVLWPVVEAAAEERA